MKKCYNIKTWEEQKSYNGLCATEHINVTISLDESYISFNSYTKIDQDFIDKSQYDLDRYGDCNFYNTSKKIEQSTPTDPVLARLCELTGAKMYDDYVVLSIFDKNISDDNNEYEILDTTAFEEYSKHLRNEENKFEEIKKLLDL